MHSSDNVGMQKMVQKFCEALKKLKIKTFTASACFLLDPSNFIQYNPYAAPPLWLYNNRYTGDPMELTVAQAEAQICERFRYSWSTRCNLPLGYTQGIRAQIPG